MKKEMKHDGMKMHKDHIEKTVHEHISKALKNLHEAHKKASPHPSKRGRPKKEGKEGY